MIRHLSLLVMLAAAAIVPARAADPGGWLTHPEAAPPVVLEFRREVDLARVPARLPVDVTADNRFILKVNGKLVGRGPSTGTIARWRQSRLDLAPALVKGHNEITAVVWNHGKFAPLAQQSLATGFRLTGAAFGTESPGWEVRIDASRTVVSGSELLRPEYYVASTPEVIDAGKPPGAWVAAVPAPDAKRTLIADPLPPQREADAAPGETVRSSFAGATFPRAPLTIPARTQGYLLIRRDAMVSAYPELRASGGRGANIKVTYAEALYDTEGRKGDRNLVADREPRGFFDTFVGGGGSQAFAPLWWRTWRFMKIEVVTADEPLTLESLGVHETGYPFEQVGRFESDDAELNRIFDIGWRTLRVDAHETFMDSSFWEQLQYAGDTRLEMLITYAVGGDPRLALQAIDAFAESNIEGGIMEGAYPSRGHNVITTFSLAWIAMLHDWAFEQPDAAPIRRHLPRVREVLGWFGNLRTPRGLLGANPHWNFIDWSGQRWDDRTVFPSYGKEGGSCLMTVLWLGALRQAADLESAHGDAARAAEDRAQATAARAAIRAHCWNAARGLFADNPSFADPASEKYSQHMNALAVLYDVATKDEAPGILERITVAGRGIDAPDGMFAMTYYFAWYLVRACEHAGLADHYHALLQTWRDLLPLNYTTWPESRGKTRSDTHAWSAHPTADLLGIVAGIRPGAPGYSRVHIEPHLGALKRVDATAATPHGPVVVSYRVEGNRLNADIRSPRGLRGEFVWAGKPYPLTGMRTRISVDIKP
ncbi:MAG TPA: alpha-L-rhamnosidase C-terminal domain-containing protein [Steroidobacteraceae bacterium]|nr:alpha-L-rhamnosidase C-terminal domain-containing protein [Steroidobacteraceae bacterium]